MKKMINTMFDFEDFIKANLATIWQRFKNNIVKISVKINVFVLFYYVFKYF